MTKPHRAVAVVPVNDMTVSLAFYKLLGFVNDGSFLSDDYAILADGKGGELHLTLAPDGWLIPGKSPFGLYLYVEDVDGLAANLAGRLLHKPRQTEWGAYEFAVSDPDENLVRVGRSL